MFRLETTEQFGRGLYANRHIGQGEIITECEILVLSPDDTKTVNTTELQYYTFVYNETQDCLVLGFGEIFNHDDSANVSYELIDFAGRKVMQFKAKSFIPIDSQLFIDYSQDIQVEVDDYKNQKSLVG